MSSSVVANLFNTSSPRPLCTISLPLKISRTFTLLPSSKNFLACFAFVCRSCSPIFVLRRIPFTSTFFCFFFWVRDCFCCSYLNLPQSIILQTGGAAFGDISTRSKPSSSASLRASDKGTTPMGSSSLPIRRT